MNVNRYEELKSKGHLELKKLGDEILITGKRYDPETGEEQVPELVKINLDELLRQKANLLHTVAALDLLINDVKGL